MIAVMHTNREKLELCTRHNSELWYRQMYGITDSPATESGDRKKRLKGTHLTVSAAAMSMETAATISSKVERRLREPICIDVLERVDLEALNWIDLHRKRLFKSQGEATRFHRYADMVRDSGGEYRVRFAQRGHGVGRMYAEKSMSLTNVNRRARASLAKAYLDVDMSNAHPTILLATAQRHGWNAPELQRVVARREEVYTLFPCARKIAKRIVLSTIMGGSAMTVLRQENLEHLRVKMPAFAGKFAQEIKMLRRFIYSEYKALHCAISPEKTNPEASCLSFFLQEEELKVLLSAREHLLEQRREVGPLIYDGLLVLKEEERPLGAVQLAALRSHVHKQTKYDIPFTVKEFSGAFDGCP